jgi:hypothetical protein
MEYCAGLGGRFWGLVVLSHVEVARKVPQRPQVHLETVRRGARPIPLSFTTVNFA